MQKVGEVKQSEDLENEVVAAVEAAPKLETPPVVTLEGAGEAGRVVIESAADPVAIIDTNDREVMAAEAAADGGPRTEDRELGIAETAADGRPGTEDQEAIINTNDQETSPGSEGETSVGGSSAIHAVASDGQEETKSGEYGFHYEFSGTTPEIGEEQ